MAKAKPKKKPGPKAEAHRANGVPRRPLLTPTVIRHIERAIEKCIPLKHAAGAIGIGYTSLMRWQAQGEKDAEEGVDSLHRELWESMSRTRAERAERLLSTLIEATEIKSNVTGQLDSKPATWLLEKLEPWDFGQLAKVEFDATVRTEDPRERLARLLGPIAAAGAARPLDPDPTT